MRTYWFMMSNWWLMLLLALSACTETVYLVEQEVDGGSGRRLTFVADGSYVVADFDETRTAQQLSELGSRLNFSIFLFGTIVYSVKQLSSDDDFGTVTVNLEDGDYEVVLLVHSCDGNATISTTESIKFPNNKVTDTFLYYNTLTVTADATYSLEVKRRVAMYRLIVDEEIPADVVQLQFYYLGGSSTLDATLGFGCVSSRQTEYRTVSSYQSGQTFEVYTFPHEESDELNMVITALDSNGDTYIEQTFQGIPIEVNKVTTHTCALFSLSSSNIASVYGDATWDGVLTYE